MQSMISENPKTMIPTSDPNPANGTPATSQKIDNPMMSDREKILIKTPRLETHA